MITFVLIDAKNASWNSLQMSKIIRYKNRLTSLEV